MALSTRWKHHIEAWQTSGLTQAEYCRQHGLNTGTFSARLREYRTAPTPAVSGLIPIRLEPAVASRSEPLVLRLASGHCLELPAAAELRWLAKRKGVRKGKGSGLAFHHPLE